MLSRYLEYVQFQGISPVSKIIQRITRDIDSHSAVIDRERMGTKQLIEQWPHAGGIKAWMDYNDYSGHEVGTPYEIWSLEVKPSIYYYCMEHYRKAAEMKQEYDWAGIIGFITGGSGSPDKTYCSEIMITPLAYVNGWDRIKPEVVHPGYFRNLIQAHGAKVTFKGIV